MKTFYKSTKIYQLNISGIQKRYILATLFTKIIKAWELDRSGQGENRIEMTGELKYAIINSSLFWNWQELLRLVGSFVYSSRRQDLKIGIILDIFSIASTNLGGG